MTNASQHVMGRDVEFPKGIVNRSGHRNWLINAPTPAAHHAAWGPERIARPPIVHAGEDARRRVLVTRRFSALYTARR